MSNCYRNANYDVNKGELVILQLMCSMYQIRGEDDGGGGDEVKYRTHFHHFHFGMSFAVAYFSTASSKLTINKSNFSCQKLINIHTILSLSPLSDILLRGECLKNYKHLTAISRVLHELASKITMSTNVHNKAAVYSRSV